MSDRVFRMSSFTINNQEYEALIKSVPRSYKLDVWAAKIPLLPPEIYELKYIGRVAPDIPEDTLITDVLVRDLISNSKELIE